MILHSPLSFLLLDPSQHPLFESKSSFATFSAQGEITMTSLRPRIIVGDAGFEPETFASEV